MMSAILTLQLVINLFRGINFSLFDLRLRVLWIHCAPPHLRQDTKAPSTRRRHPAERQTPPHPRGTSHDTRLSGRHVAISEQEQAKQKYEEITKPVPRIKELDELSFEVAYQSGIEASMIGHGLQLIFRDSHQLTYAAIENNHKNVNALIASKVQPPGHNAN